MGVAKTIAPTLGRALDWLDLDWPRRPVDRVSSAGTPYQAWVPTGVPRIPSEYLNVAIYLYESVADAESGSDLGGTGFLVAVKSAVHQDGGYLYAVSNRHVVQDGASVVRVNLVGGGTDTFNFEPIEWTFHPAGDDLAVVPISIDRAKHLASWVPIEMAVTPEEVGADDSKFTIGDDVWQIGRFVMNDGKTVNRPSARFGNLSIPLNKISGTTIKEQESFGVEVHSISGYSGSPVFIIRGLMGIGPTGGNLFGGNPIGLLGVCWAHIPIDEAVMERIVTSREMGLRRGERAICEPQLWDGRSSAGMEATRTA